MNRVFLISFCFFDLGIVLCSGSRIMAIHKLRKKKQIGICFVLLDQQFFDEAGSPMQKTLVPLCRGVFRPLDLKHT